MIIENTQKCTITLPTVGRTQGPILRPGSNVVDAEYWAQVQSNEAVAMYVKTGALKLPVQETAAPEKTTPAEE